jgi:hypothetical protein
VKLNRAQLPLFACRCNRQSLPGQQGCWIDGTNLISAYCGQNLLNKLEISDGIRSARKSTRGIGFLRRAGGSVSQPMVTWPNSGQRQSPNEKIDPKSPYLLPAWLRAMRPQGVRKTHGKHERGRCSSMKGLPC